MRRGFTLIETLASLAVMAILIYATASAFVNLAPKYRLGRATWEIQTQLNFARYRAIRQGNPVRILFRPEGYTIEKYIDGPDVWQAESAGAIEGVRIEANNTPTFYPAGTVSNFATILVSNTWGKNKITLAITGRIKVTKL
jgi:prepilin-type N-terminal cleavage/methylation domain-containing protein